MNPPAFSTHIRDFIYRPPPTAFIRKKIKVLLVPFYPDGETYDRHYDDVCEYLLQHLVVNDQSIVRENKKGCERLRERYITSKVQSLRCILFDGEDEEVSETMIPFSEYMDMKQGYERLLLQSRNEIVRLQQIISRNPSPESLSPAHSPLIIDLSGSGHSPDHAPVDEIEQSEVEYQNVNSALDDLALLSEVRERHNSNEEVRPPDPVIKERLIDVEDEIGIDVLAEQLQSTSIDDSDLELSCPICLAVLNTDAHSDDYTGCCIGNFCGHALCDECWKQYRRRGNKNCPVCRQLLFLGRGRPPKANVW